MQIRATTVLAAAFLCLAPMASWADLSVYNQNFEGLVQTDPAALSNDGWFVYANVFDLNHNYIGGYGFPAPNGAGRFCDIDLNQGGPSQGVQQLSVYSDYGNTEHLTRLIEANVYHEQVVGTLDVGKTCLFQFDAKRGNLGGATTALAFIKTLNPSAGWAMTNFITVDMTSIPTSWGTFQIQILIDPSLVGQILQFGFANTSTNYEPSGVFYDNVAFCPDGLATPAAGKSWGQLKALYR